MSEVTEYSEMSGENEEITSGRSESESTSIESGGRDDFIKWVSVHKEEVQTIICRSREFGAQPFCGEDRFTRMLRAFMWRGAAP